MLEFAHPDPLRTLYKDEATGSCCRTYCLYCVYRTKEEEIGKFGDVLIQTIRRQPAEGVVFICLPDPWKDFLRYNHRVTDFF